jgi:hypothetical protein
MADTPRHDCDQPKSENLCDAIDPQLKLTLNYLVDLSSGMKMPLNGRPTRAVEAARLMDIAPLAQITKHACPRPSPKHLL